VSSAMNRLSAVICLLCLPLALVRASGEGDAPDPQAIEAAVDRLREVCKRRSRGVRLWSLAGKDGWMFMDEELRHVSKGRFWGDYASKVSRIRKRGLQDPLPAILNFRDRLRELDIELILFPVPPKVIIYPDMLMDMGQIPLYGDGRMPRLDPAHQAFYSLLREQGLTVYDPTQRMLESRFVFDGPLYCKQDHHYAGLAIRMVAPELAELVKAQAWYKARPAAAKSGRYESERRQVQIRGDLWQTYRLKVRKPPEREVISLDFVGFRDDAGKLVPIPDDPQSPVLLLGGSHALIFHTGGDMHARGAGLADHLALELGFPIDVVATRGDMSHNPRISLFRRSKKDPDSLRNKKVVIWCFSARGFSEYRWSTRIPLLPSTQ
jgi:hypothetical protein